MILALKRFSDLTVWHRLTAHLIIILFALTIPPKASSQELRVAVAANAQFVTQALKKVFTEETGIKTTLIVSSSGKLTAQIRQGAPFDVFLSADMKYPATLYKEGQTADKPKVYAYGKLVLWTLGSTDLSNGIKVVTNQGITKIAIANPQTAPYGVAAVEALKKAGFYDKVKSKLVYGESISQVNQYLLSGAADIALTAKSVVLSPGMKSKGHWKEVDHNLYEPIAQGVIITKTAHMEAAEKFYKFLFSKKAEGIFEKYGYLIK